MKQKSRIKVLALAAVVVTLGVGGVVIGSNMGFKFNLALTGGVDQWVSLPYNNPYPKADDVINALMPGGGEIRRYLPTSPPTFDNWFGTGGSANFDIVPGEGYELKPLSSGNAVVVGSHNPFSTVPAGGFTGNLEYLISIPYHTTAQNADDLLADLPGTGGTVRRILPGNPPGFDFWFGTGGSANFPVVLGEAYVIRPLSSTPGYIPAHF